MSKLANFRIKPIMVASTGWKSTKKELPNPEVIVAKAGTRVICPKCQAPIGKLFSDLYSGVSCRADQIEFERDQIRHPHEKAECKKCGTGYMVMSMSYRNGTSIILSVDLMGRQVWI